MTPGEFEHGLLQVRLATADADQTAAGLEQGIADLQGQVDAFLLHQARDHREQRPLARLQAETLLHVARVGALAGPLAGAEAGHQVRIAVRLPAIVDTVDDAAELTLLDLVLEDAVQAAAVFRGSDFLGVGLAHRGDVVGMGDAGLEERQAPVELHAFVAQRFVGEAQFGAALQVAEALVGEVVDGKQARRAHAVPGHVGRRQRRRPVVGVHQARLPAWAPRPPAISAAARHRRAKRRWLSGQSLPWSSMYGVPSRS